MLFTFVVTGASFSTFLHSYHEMLNRLEVNRIVWDKSMCRLMQPQSFSAAGAATCPQAISGSQHARAKALKGACSSLDVKIVSRILMSNLDLKLVSRTFQSSWGLTLVWNM